MPIKLMLVGSTDWCQDVPLNQLKDEPRINVLRQVESGREATDLAARLLPDIILMDSYLPDGSGISTMRQILSRQPGMVFLIFSAVESETLLIEAIRYGAKGCLPKTISKSTLVYCLQALNRGEAIIPRKMMACILAEISHPYTERPNHNQEIVNGLTYRELDVLKRLENRATNREIASALIISENTVRVHIHNILDKLQLKNRREAADFAQRLKVIGCFFVSAISGVNYFWSVVEGFLPVFE